MTKIELREQVVRFVDKLMCDKIVTPQTYWRVVNRIEGNLAFLVKPATAAQEPGGTR